MAKDSLRAVLPLMVTNLAAADMRASRRAQIVPARVEGRGYEHTAN
jgi:hypothetical protein